MKKIFTCILTLFLLANFISPHIVNATEVDTEITYMDNGDYIETTIISYSLNRSTTKTATKTATYKNSFGDALWSVSVTCTFSYDYGISCTCTNVSGDSQSYSSNWKVSDVITSKTGNTGTAKATGTKYLAFLPTNSYELSVTLTCDNYGNLS